jgi:ribosome-binding protein aMBF1 (putative translation factor)
MKLNLDRKWFEDRISTEDNCDVSAGAAPEEPAAEHELRVVQHPEDEFVETHSFGTLVVMLRRDRMLSVEELAKEARISAADILNIEVDPNYVPNPGAVHQLAEYFHIPQRSLLKLANATIVHNDRLREAAVRFAAGSSQVMKLSREERAALTEFVELLSSQDAD